MKIKRLKHRGDIGILIAVLCLIILFVGFKITDSITNMDDEDSEFTNIFKNSENLIDEDYEVVTAFNSIDNIEEKNNFVINVNEDNLFLRLLVNSNAYMGVVYENGSIRSRSGIVENIFSFFEPETYLKAQLPAIFTFVDITEENAEKVFESNAEKEVPVLGDILFIESPEELEEGENISENNEGTNNTQQVVEIPDAIVVDNENPSILIYHTHTTEAYLPIKKDQYHTTERKYSVLAIGDIITESLIEKGNKVKHVDIYHDIPSYNKAYTRSLETVKKVLKEEKNIEVVLDVHRDAYADNVSIKTVNEKSKVSINGTTVATFALVIGPDNVNKDKLIKFAKYIEATANELYPGFCRGIIIKPMGRFNQFVSDHYALIEVGSNLNTIDEAKKSAELIAEVLDEVIKEISQ